MSAGRCLLLLAAAAAAASAGAQDDCPPEEACRRTPTDPVCGGRGRCLCGACECNRRSDPSEVVSGAFCECANFTCPRSGGRLCGGTSRGRCECDQCVCAEGWTGDACDCSASTESCVEPGSSRVCSNRGICSCGQCKCFQHEGEAYMGKYCETCPTCAGSCAALRPCVECLAYKTGPLRDGCEVQCSHVQLTRVDEAVVTNDRNERMCDFYNSDNCRYRFVYSSDGSVRLEDPPQCPETTRSRYEGSTSGGSVALPSLMSVVWNIFG